MLKKKTIPTTEFYSDRICEQIPDYDEPTQPTNELTNDQVFEIINNFIDNSIVAPSSPFTATDSHTLPENLQEMIREFKLWQQGPQGGGNKEVTAAQHSEMMRRLMVEMKITALVDLLDDHSLWRLFYLKKINNIWTGQTSRSYLVALKKFMAFISKDGRRGLYSTERERTLANCLLVDFPGWSKSYKNQIGIESAKKKMLQINKLITPDKVNKYVASEEYRRAYKILAECDGDGFILTQKSFAIVRNYLLFNLNKRNGNRAGVLGEMTIDTYNTKKRMHCKETGMTQCMITIMNHKTLASSGPAKIALTPLLVTQMDIYRDYIRPVVAGDSEFFFTTYRGMPLTDASLIGKGISAHAKAAGLGHMTSNDCRRSATTIARIVDSTMAGPLSVHMNHSESTANKVYNIVDKDRASFNAAAFLDKCYDGTLKSTSSIHCKSII